MTKVKGLVYRRGQQQQGQRQQQLRGYDNSYQDFRHSELNITTYFTKGFASTYARPKKDWTRCREECPLSAFHICLRQKTGADLSKPPTVTSLWKFIALIVLIYRTMDLVLLKSTTNNYLTFIIFEILPEITQWLLYKRRKMITHNWK